MNKSRQQEKQIIALLRKGSGAWNSWRQSTGYRERIELVGASLTNIDLRQADLHDVWFSGIDFKGSDLTQADLSWTRFFETGMARTSLRGADLSMTVFGDTDFTDADLEGADLGGAYLGGCSLKGANLSNTRVENTHFSNTSFDDVIFGGAQLFGTIFIGVDLSRVIGLELVDHDGPSTVDLSTLHMSGPLPLSFLRGIGLSDAYIDYLPSLLNQAIQMYSCFISYSSKDHGFAERVHADLQSHGVRCWFAPHDLQIGAKTWDKIDEAIRLRDKLLLILSKNSIASDWVEDEVNQAFAEERQRGDLVLVPIRIDNTVMETSEPWARKLMNQRNIGDFRKWKDHDKYQFALKRLISDLTKKPQLK